MKKYVIWQTKNIIGITPAHRFNRIKYEKELSIIRCLLCECSGGFDERMCDCDQQELVKVLNKELNDDKQTIYSN